MSDLKAALPVSDGLKLLPAYTGAVSVEEALKTPRTARLLWLEILVNDQLDLAPWWHRSEVHDAYTKACRWYTSYRSLINATLSRAPLPCDPGRIDTREYRVFAEALSFIANQR